MWIVFEIQLNRLLLHDLDILKNVLQNIMNETFPATTRSRGEVGFHILVLMKEFAHRVSIIISVNIRSKCQFQWYAFPLYKKLLK